MNLLMEETWAVPRRSFPRKRESIPFWSDIVSRFRGGEDVDSHFFARSVECAQLVEVDDGDVLAQEILRQAKIVSKYQVSPGCGMKDGCVG
jgi:hypothetical protein